jgi:hypothetical protein
VNINETLSDPLVHQWSFVVASAMQMTNHEIQQFLDDPNEYAAQESETDLAEEERSVPFSVRQIGNRC